VGSLIPDHEARRAPSADGVLDDVIPAHGSGARIREDSGAEDSQQGALAGAVWPEKRYYLAELDIQTDAVERLDVAESFADLTNPDAVHIAGCYVRRSQPFDRGRARGAAVACICFRAVLAREYVQGGRRPGKVASLVQRLLLERRYGMPPGALRQVDLVDIGYGAPERVREHIPSPWGVLRRILRGREVTAGDVFLDLGCGMGPVLVEAAARYDFRRVIGVDIVPEFTAIARETITRGQGRLRCRDIEVLTCDVMDYEIPDDVTVVYMADPFRGHVFDAAMAKLIASVDRNPRRLRIVYNFPVEGGRIERTGRAQLVRFGRRAGRPWTRTSDLAMYEIESSGDGVGRGRREMPRVRRGLIGRLEPNPPLGGVPSSPSGTPQVPIKISRSTSGGWEVASAASTEYLASLRAEFERRHCVLLPGFLDDQLLSRIQSYVDGAGFSVSQKPGIGTEHWMDRGEAVALLLMLINDPRLFGFVREITGCKPIGRFDGSIYRTMPGPESDEAWHGEIFGHGIIELSIDLSTRRCDGAALQTRDRQSGEILGVTGPTAPGDALLVRLAPSVQQRTTPVEGDCPRTVYAGRFMVEKRGSNSKLAQASNRSPAQARP
jgi:SAM-dependent methyltransferase